MGAGRDIFRTPQRWLWLVAPVIVGVLAWLMLEELHTREERASRAEAKAEQIADNMGTSVRLGAAIWLNDRGERGQSALTVAVGVQAGVLAMHADELAEILPGDPQVERLQALIESSAGIRVSVASLLGGLREAGGEIERLTDTIRTDQQARREAARRQTRIGSAVVLVLAILSLVILATRAHRQIAAVGRRHAARLERMAGEDSLTGLLNRRSLDADLQELHGGPVQMILCDLDGFKAYNDTHGHAAGDVLLADFARVLEQAAGDDGRAYRLGGDEFCVVSAPGVDLTDRAEVLAETTLDGGVTASIGIAVWPDDESAPEAALRVADERMYAAKRDKRRKLARAV
ncbi:MAG: GGDEF domain-containing protein [Solirubrobacteraceae bacterium]|nr:GGDEF domain-containing protein [Solirubrobacteraceae bacterium]